MRKALEEFPNAKDIVAYAVWFPNLPGDNRARAQEAMNLMPLRNVRHYWVSDRDIGRAFGRALGFPDRVAWDIYLIYGPGKHTGAWPPKPDYWHGPRPNPSRFANEMSKVRPK